MAGMKRRAAKAGLTTGEDTKTKEALDDLKSSVKLLGRSIDGVLDELPDCHVGLIEHGIALILSRGDTANQTSINPALRQRTPMLKPGVVETSEARRRSAGSMDRGPMNTEPPSVRSVAQGVVRGGRGAPIGGPACADSSPWPPSSESSWQADTDDASSELSEEEGEGTSAKTSSPSSSTLSRSSPAAAADGSSRSRSSTQALPQGETSSAFNVFLEWYAAGPGVVAGEAVESLAAPGLLRDSSHLDVPTFFQVWDRNSDKGDRVAGGPVETAAVRAARRVNLVVWHLTSRTLELPVDETFSTANVADALGRELALNFAMVTLLEAANDHRCLRPLRQRTDDDEAEVSNDPVASREDPGVVEFFARFDANVQALMEEARTAPAASSAPPPNLSRSLEDGLRAALGSVRRRHRKKEDIYHSSHADNLVATDARPSASGPTAATPGAMAMPRRSVDVRHQYRGAPSAADDALAVSSNTVVLRPMEDLFRVYSEAELMVAFEKVTGGQMPGGCYEMWFERKRIVRTGVVFRHEYVMKTGHWYGG